MPPSLTKFGFGYPLPCNGSPYDSYVDNRRFPYIPNPSAPGVQMSSPIVDEARSKRRKSKVVEQKQRTPMKSRTDPSRRARGGLLCNPFPSPSTDSFCSTSPSSEFHSTRSSTLPDIIAGRRRLSSGWFPPWQDYWGHDPIVRRKSVFLHISERPVLHAPPHWRKRRRHVGIRVTLEAVASSSTKKGRACSHPGGNTRPVP